MGHYPELFVLRHGQTEWNVGGRYQGQMDSALTPLGLQQAGMQAEILAKVMAGRELPSFVSPLGRAVATAEIALNGQQEHTEHDDRLMEINFGKWEGMTRPEVEAELPSALKEGQNLGWYFHAPEGERFDDISKRVRGFLEALSGPSIVVTHGVTSMVLRGLWLGYGEAELLKLPHGQGCVYHLKEGMERCLEA